MAAPPALLRGLPFLRLRLHLHLRLRLRLHQTSPPPGVFALQRRPICSSASASESIQAESESNGLLRVQSLSKLLTTTSARADDPDYRKWKDKEDEILRDIQPTSLFAKHILHSHRYMDGERLTKDDEKFVLDNLLAYHPHTVDKIGCGLDSIMVDRHPQFKHSRCLFVVRTDGGWIDFSYQKCLREYIRKKYPSYAERFIREHFKRSSG